ncbi:MAG: glycosyltransferase [Gammaproteobacteria bacterium]|nr:glycosyltransferase [Gammaproteobacteria bacterium]
MKIIHLATQDIGGGGGAFDASYRLHCNMMSVGIDSAMVVLRKETDDVTVVDISKKLFLTERIRRFLFTIKKKYIRWKYKPSPYFFVQRREYFSVDRLLDDFPFKPDVIIAHWVSDFVSLQMLGEMSRITGAPVLWYLMDMAPLTGGCHYAFECKGYTKQCGYCPQLSSKHEQDLSSDQWFSRQKIIKKMDITPVAGSTWLMERIEESTIFHGKQGKKILLGLNADIFTPANQDDARSQLDLPLNKKIIFFGAQNIYEERKGIYYLIEALKLLYSMLDDNPQLKNEILVVMAGSNADKNKLDIPFEHRHIGFLRGDVALATGYQAADVFVNPSIEDAGPMMINESILCGTPVVAFEMGVAKDLVHTSQTGYRARLKDERDMAIGIRRILELDDNVMCKMRENCRNLGVKLCHPSVQTQAFKELCVEIIKYSDEGIGH